MVERESFLRVVRETEPHFYPFILFMAETGCRIGEAIDLRWEDVDVAAGEARLYRAKTRTTDDVELSPRLCRELKMLIRPDGSRAFTTPGGHEIGHENFRRRIWAPLVERTFNSRRKITPHSLRHTWASLHLAAGTPVHWVQKQGGWASAKMLLDVYGHFVPKQGANYAANLEPEVQPDATRPQRVSQRGVPAGIRTPDLPLRRRPLYPAELRGRDGRGGRI